MRCVSSPAISHTCGAVAVQFFAVGGAQQLNDKNGKKLALKFPSASRFSAVISKLRTHLPGDDNLVGVPLLLHPPASSFKCLLQFCFISCGDAQFAPSPDALIGDLYRVSARPALSVAVQCPSACFPSIVARVRHARLSLCA